MGQTLSEPVVEKHTNVGEDDRLAFAVSEMQGWRMTMEDAHAAVLDLDAAPPTNSSASADAQGKGARTSFFAVYDGHGGSTVAKYSGDTVHFRLRSTDEYQRQEYEAALKRAFLATDEDLRNNPDFNSDPSGCTAVVALITPDHRVLVANAGDSRSVLSVNGVAKPMSHDHKPVNPTENDRIVAAGGFVEFGRVNGNLALSRALGDFEFKQNKSMSPEQQVVTADPDIICHQIGPDDEFLILACDGIWDVYSNQQVVDRVRRLIGEGKPLERVAEDMIDACLAPSCELGGVGCDNMTFMVVAIMGSKTKEEWREMIRARLTSSEGHQTPSTFPNPYAQERGTAADGAVAGRALAGGVMAQGAVGGDPNEPPPVQEDGPSSLTDNRFLELKPLRTVERALAVRQGLIPDPLKPRRLDEALPFVGTCLDMCPEFERHEREYQNNSDKWERYPGTFRIDPKKAVKAFHRPAAGNDQPLPSDVRPPDILKTTLDYLFKTLLAKESLFETHGFIRDRTRSIRQDFTLQNERGQAAIECHERIARYHILCLHFLREKEGIGSYQEQQELEQVRKVLQSLNEFYDDYRGSNCLWPNEAEFRAYYLLTHLRDFDAARATEGLPQEVFSDPRLQCAIQLQILAQCGNMSRAPGRRPANSPATLNAFTRLFKKIGSSQTSFLSACLLETHFRDIRVSALKALRSAQSAKYGASVTLSEIARLCAMSLEECHDFCLACGLKMTTASLEKCTVELHKHAPFDDQLATFRTRKSEFVAAKAATLSIIELIEGNATTQPRDGSAATTPAPTRPLRHLPLQSSPATHATFAPDSSITSLGPKSVVVDRSAGFPIKTNNPVSAHHQPQLTSLSFNRRQSSPRGPSKPPESRFGSEKALSFSSAKTALVSPSALTSHAISMPKKTISPPAPSIPTVSPHAHVARERTVNCDRVINNLTVELLSSIMESTITQVAQQTLMERSMNSRLQEKEHNAHIVTHFCRSLESMLLSEVVHDVVFDLASSALLDLLYKKQQERLLGVSFYKWLRISRTRKFVIETPNDDGITMQAAQYLNVGDKNSIWSPGSLRQVAGHYIWRKVLLEPLMNPGYVVKVLIGVPQRLPLVHAWLRCKFGIEAKQDQVQFTLKDVPISINLVNSPVELDPKQLTEVALTIIWRDPHAKTDVFLTQLVKDVKAHSLYNPCCIAVSWPPERPDDFRIDRWDDDLQQVYLSITTPEIELQRALSDHLPVSLPRTPTCVDNAAYLSPFSSAWRKAQRKAVALLDTYFPNDGCGLKLETTYQVLTLLLRFGVDTVKIMVDHIGKTLHPLNNCMVAHVSKALHLAYLSDLEPETLDQQLNEYQSSLPLGNFALNLSNLLDAKAQLPLTEFSQLFGQYLLTALTDCIVNYVHPTQAGITCYGDDVEEAPVRFLVTHEIARNVMMGLQHDLDLRFRRVQHDLQKLFPKISQITKTKSSIVQVAAVQASNTYPEHGHTNKKKKLSKSDKVAELRQLVNSTRLAANLAT